MNQTIPRGLPERDAPKATEHYHSVSAGGIELLLPPSTPLPPHQFIGQKKVLLDCLVAFTPIDGRTLSFRLTGPPGVGKNEIAYEVARELRRPLYILQGNADLQPEDLACRYRMTADNKIECVASELMAAMLQGGVCLFDEIGKVPSRALSLLASVLDDRRTITSSLAGVTVQAHPEFRFMATLNDSDAAVASLPGFLDERLRPEFRVDYPSVSELVEIIKSRLSGCDEHILDHFRAFAADRFRREKPFSPREALTTVGCVLRRLCYEEAKTTSEDISQWFSEAERHVASQ